MQMKYILKSLFLTSLCASAYAARDDCKELRTYLDYAMTDCVMNDNGEMIELGFNTYREETTEEGYKKAFSYPTLKKLTFYDEYNDCIQLTYGLSNLKNLEELYIRSFRSGIAPNALKGLTSLKKFYFTTGDYSGGLDKVNLEELGTLTNLESITFSFTGLDKEGLKSLQNLNKVTSLTLTSNGKASMDVEGCLANLKNLKELTVGYGIRHQSQIDAITSYPNLEKLTVGFDMNEIKCDNMKNLTKLNTLVLTVAGTKEMPSCVNSIPNLQKLTFNEKDIPLQNGNNTTTGNNTNQTTGNNSNQTTGNNSNQTTGNDANQTTGNDVNQVAGNDVNQAIGNNDQIAGNITNGNTTTTEPNGDINVDSAAGSTIVHAINYLPVIALIFGMLL